MGSREKHADGSHHVHIGIHFVKRPNIKDPRVFDKPACEVEGCCPDEGLIAGVNQFPEYLSAYVEFIPRVKILRVWSAYCDMSA